MIPLFFTIIGMAIITYFCIVRPRLKAKFEGRL